MFSCRLYFCVDFVRICSAHEALDGAGGGGDPFIKDFILTFLIFDPNAQMWS